MIEQDEGRPRVTRYHQDAGDQTLELRTECVRGTLLPRVLVLVVDITEQVRTERELARAHATLVERQHLRALGEMTSGLVHDLSNTVTAMRLRLELIQGDAVFVRRQQDNVEALVRIVGDATMRLGQLQTFARQQPEVLPGDRVQLVDVVHEAVEIARSDLEHRARLEGLRLRVEVEVPPLPPVQGLASDLRYVLINLLFNARDAMPRGGVIHVRGRREAGQVLLTVEDEGTGIPEEHLHSIFRPFFTTKGDKGTGLGLSMAYGVVSRAGGTITAANRPEGGARFTLAFPPAPPSSSQEPAAKRPRPARKRPAAKRPPRRRG